MTESGRLVYRYADEIFSLGQDLCASLQGQAGKRMSRLEVGVADVLPRWIVYLLLQPALRLFEPVLHEQGHIEIAARLFERLESFENQGPQPFIMQAFCEAAALHFDECSKPLVKIFEG